MDLNTYNEKFNNIYSEFKLASSVNQEPLIIKVLQHLILGYDRKFINIKDVGAWCTSLQLGAKASDYKNKVIMTDLEKIGYNYGDSFDMGEKFVKDTWNMEWDEAEKEQIKRIKYIIEKYKK